MSRKKKTALAPRLRFPAFLSTGEWQIMALSCLTNRVTTRNKDSSVNRALTNSATEGVIDQSDYFDKEVASKGNLENYFIIDEGDYVYNPRISSTAPVGPISKNKLGKGVMSPLYTVFRFKNSYNDFYEQYFRTNFWHQYLKTISNTGARHDRISVSNDSFMKMPVPYPLEEEQQKIADCLSSLDEFIAAENKKLETLKTYKKSLMQKLFPADGKTVPEIRLKGFTNAWERRKLGEICATFTDGNWIETKDQSNGGIRLLQTGNIGMNEFIDKPNKAKWISEYTFTRLKCTEVYPNDILISRLPEPAGRACIVPNIGQKMITAVDCTIIRTSEKCVSEYLVQVFSSRVYLKTVNDFLAGGTRQRISRSNLAGIIVPLPCKTEQTAIGEFFRNLDELTAAQAERIKSLQLHKKGLTQGLFPSIREVTE